MQVETFGSMEKKEKVEFILEQMRLCFETKDYIRTQIISKKISIKYFDSDETEELKLRFGSSASRYYRFKILTVVVSSCNFVYIIRN